MVCENDDNLTNDLTLVFSTGTQFSAMTADVKKARNAPKTKEQALRGRAVGHVVFVGVLPIIELDCCVSGSRT